MADVAVPTSEINLPSLLTRHDNSQSTMGQAPETWVVPDFNIPILSSMIKLTFPLLTYIGWDCNFHFYSTEYQLNLSILRTARSWLFAVTFMFSIFYSKKKLSSPVFIGVVIMRLRVFIMRVHIKACVRVLKCSKKIYNPQTSRIIFEHAKYRYTQFSDTSNQKYILYEVPKNLKFWHLISSISNFIFLPYIIQN